MTEPEKAFYRNVYKLLTNEETNSILVKYAEMQYNKALTIIRTKRDQYDHAHANGQADAWQAVINLKDHITKVMREI